MPKRTARKLSELQERARVMFREGKTNSAIAEQLGIHPRTTRRWRNTSEDNPENLQEVFSVLDKIKTQNSENVAPPQSKEQLENAVLKPKVDTSHQLFFDDDYRKILELFSLLLDNLQSLLSDSNLSPRDRISAFRLVLELRRDAPIFCSNQQQQQNSSLSDFELIKETIRQHVLSESSPQGAIALLKLLQTQESLPEHIVPNERKAERQVILSEISKMTEEEKVRLYREYTSKSLNK